MIQPLEVGALNLHHAGCWECDLSDNSLTWSGGVYDIFGLSRETRITREDAVTYYCEDSRAKMERLRAHSIKHRCGFTLDIEIQSAIAENRWVRLFAAPVYVADRTVRLHGLKLII
jgi:PAS domain-containing protein